MSVVEANIARPVGKALLINPPSMEGIAHIKSTDVTDGPIKFRTPSFRAAEKIRRVRVAEGNFSWWPAKLDSGREGTLVAITGRPQVAYFDEFGRDRSAPGAVGFMYGIHSGGRVEISTLGPDPEFGPRYRREGVGARVRVDQTVGEVTLDFYELIMRRDEHEYVVKARELHQQKVQEAASREVALHEAEKGSEFQRRFEETLQFLYNPSRYSGFR